MGWAHWEREKAAKKGMVEEVQPQSQEQQASRKRAGVDREGATGKTLTGTW